MRGSFRIARIAGIPIRIHVSFLMVLPFFAYIFGTVFREAARMAGVPQQGLTVGAWLWGLGLTLALFAAVLVHELAHSLYARAKGGEVREITLLMLGGVSQLTRMPDGPRREATMAAVGPLTSLGIGALCLALYAAVGERGAFNARFALFYLGYLNLFLGVFNLLPAFPMDGGRILRAALTLPFGRLRATQIAAAVGRGFALLLGMLGLLTFNFLVVIVALFVWLGAQAEAQDVLVREVLEKVRLEGLMSRQVPTVEPFVPAAEAAALMASARQELLVVVERGAVLGALPLATLERLPREQWYSLSVRELMRPVPSLVPEADAAQALQLLDAQGFPCVVVVAEGALVGMVTREEIARALRLAALEESQRRREGPPRRHLFMRRREQHP